MTFSEYFNGLYRPLKNEEKKAVFFDQMISHFIDEDACEGCTLLHVDPETKPRYAREKNPNPIKADNAKYLYAHRNYNRYTTWVEKLLEVMDAYDVVESWLSKSGIKFEDASEACYKLLEEIFYKIGFEKSKEEAIKLPQKEKDSDIAESKWTEHDNALVAEFNSDYDEVMKMCIGDRYAQEYLTGRLSKKVNTLYNSKCYSPPILSANRHRILSIRHWLCQPIGILFCQRNEMLLRKTKAINPITKFRIQTNGGIIRIRIGMMPSLQFYEKMV